MTTLNLSTEARDITVETLKADVSVEKKWVKCADTLRGEGVTSVILEKDKDFRDYFKKEVVLLSFTAKEQAIYAKPTTSLSDEEKVTKRWVIQQIGSRLGRVTRHVKKAEIEETLSAEERGARHVAAFSTRLKRDLTKWVAAVEKAEEVTFPAVKMLALLKEAAALIKE